MRTPARWNLLTATSLLAVSGWFVAGSTDAAAWSPDGTRIAFSFIGGPEHIYLADPDGSNSRPLVVRRHRDYRPEWSPDGSHLVFTANIDGSPLLMRVAADGTDLQALSSREMAGGDPDYSPDGSRLVFHVDRPDARDLMLMDPESGAIEPLTSTTGFQETSPRWSPDGSEVAFVGRSGDDEAGDIWTIHPISGERTQVTRTPESDEFHPDWSSDGSRLVFVRVTEGVFSLVLHDLATGGERTLAAGNGYAVLDPHVSPDDRAVTFTRTDFAEQAPRMPAIVSVSLEDGEERTLVRGKYLTARLEAPDWAHVLEWEPDPGVIASESERRALLATGLPWRIEHATSGVELLLVAPGDYARGAGAGDHFDRANERPRHRVQLTRAFYLGRYEVTNEQMRRFRPDHASGTFYRAEDLTLDAETMPAVDVSWEDAAAFASHFGFRLPTEAEWEYAARAGTKTRYPWGEDPDAGRGWGNGFNEAAKATVPAMDWDAFSWDDGFVVSSPVGSFRPNAWGFHDLFGNAWEWCRDSFLEDAYARYPGGAVDPVIDEGGRRTLRGGGWGNAPRGSGTPYRFGMDPSERFDGNGFRVARPP